MDKIKNNIKPKLALIFSTLFSCLNYLIPVFYSIAWFKLGLAETLASDLERRYGENIYLQIVGFISIFFFLYLAFPLLLFILKIFIYWITGLRKNILGSFRLDLARILVLIPVLRKLVRITPLSDYDEPLYKRLTDWAKIEGNEIADIQVLHVKHYSRETNAFFFGVGRFSKVILLDTLFDTYTHSEIEAIIAHEFGHKHDFLSTLSIVLSCIVGAALVAGLGLWYIATLGSIKYVPLLALLLIVYWFSIMLLYNSVSKYKELFADTYAILHIPNSNDLKNVLLKPTSENFDTISPPRLIEFIFFSHPSTSKRLANIESLKRVMSK